MKKGDATNIWAKTTAVVVNGMVTPRFSNSGPISPLRPKVINMATPATTGGRTSGNSTRPSTALAQRQLLRANTYAKGVPRTTTTAILIMLVTKDTCIAANVASLVTASKKSLCWAARTNSASTGRPINRTYSTAPTPPNILTGWRVKLLESVNFTKVFVSFNAQWGCETMFDK